MKNCVKYYIYISDAKVDMLLPQVPHNIDKKIGMEVGFDLKLFSAKRKVESETERDRVTRLEKVVSFIEQFGTVGSMEEPDEYIADVVSMKFGPLMEQTDNFGGITFFTAQNESTTLGLFGSAAHMIGAKGTGKIDEMFSGSCLNHIMNYLVGRGKESSIFRSLRYLAQEMEGPDQRLEFMAKRLMQGSVKLTPHVPEERGAKLITIATPLYVALAD